MSLFVEIMLFLRFNETFGHVSIVENKISAKITKTLFVDTP
jgi:hypothetical protein